MDIQSIVLWAVVVLSVLLSIRLHNNAWSKLSAGFGFLSFSVLSFRGGSVFWLAVSALICIALVIWAICEAIGLQRQSRDAADKSRSDRQDRRNDYSERRAILDYLAVTEYRGIPESLDLEEAMDGWPLFSSDHLVNRAACMRQHPSNKEYVEPVSG